MNATDIHDITTGQDCTECKFFKVYTTGIDEYPQCTTIAYCSKGHWLNSSRFRLIDTNLELSDIEVNELLDEMNKSLTNL